MPMLQPRRRKDGKRMLSLIVIVALVAIIAAQAIMLDRAFNRAERAERRLKDAEHVLRRTERLMAEERRQNGYMPRP